jgi:hypothetical protein
MDIKQFKNLKDSLNDKLYMTFRDFIQGGTIKTNVQDNLENLDLLILQEIPSGDFNLVIIETTFSFNTKNPSNILGKFNNRTIAKNNEGTVMGTFSDYSRIDLETMSLIKDQFYNFAIENDLIELDKEAIKENNNEDTLL